MKVYIYIDIGGNDDFDKIVAVSTGEPYEGEDTQFADCVQIWENGKYIKTEYWTTAGYK